MKHINENMENCIATLCGIYGMQKPFIHGQFARQLEWLGRISVVRFEILDSINNPLIIYNIHPDRFSGELSLVVPIREGLSDRELNYRITVDREPINMKIQNPHWKTSIVEQRKRIWTYETEESGVSIKANEIVGSKGVISRFIEEKGWGFVQSGEQLFFLKKWMTCGHAEEGMEVSYLPVVQIHRGLQARLVSPE